MSQQPNIVTTTQVGPRGIPEALFIVSFPFTSTPYIGYSLSTDISSEIHLPKMTTNHWYIHQYYNHLLTGGLEQSCTG
jgi:hypothetical protein